MSRNTTPEKQREYNRKSYATKLGLTVEQLDARRQAAREWKQRNKYRRAKEGYMEIASHEKLTPGPKTGNKWKNDKWWEQLKAKHAGKSRLHKSIKPPILLNLQDDEV